VKDDDVPEGSGIDIFAVYVPLGADQRRRHFARIVTREGEALPETRARLERWLAGLPLPAGKRFAYELDTAHDDDTGKTTVVGYRTILLEGAPILTTEDVSDATAVSGRPPSVHIELTSAGAARFEAASSEWVQRRLAILVDGEVTSAPIVKQAIRGGRLSLTTGSVDGPEELSAAIELATKLRP
jgi:preprotein translocase subunit SecD